MSASLLLGRTVDRYQVERLLGRGGLATVLQVRHVLLGTTHAMKLLYAPSPTLVERLLREGRVQARLRHPNLVAVTDVVPYEQDIALILDYVAGPNLAQLLDLVRLSLDERDLLADQILRGVEAAHGAGVIHRDLKPLNVLIAVEPDGLVARVTDFGLARALSEAQNPRLTVSGVAMGTPAYMAPEQHRDASAADERADVFSLGVLLYELLTGQLPFRGEAPAELLAQAEAGAYVPLAGLDADIPPRMARAVDAALAARPEDRPDGVSALRALWRDGTAPPPAPWSPANLSRVNTWIMASELLGEPVAGSEPLLNLPRALAPATTAPAPEADTFDLTPPDPPPPTGARREWMALALLALAVLAIGVWRFGGLGSTSTDRSTPAVAAPPAAIEAAIEVAPTSPPPLAEAAPATAPPEVSPKKPRSTLARVRLSGVTRGLLIDESGATHPISEAVAPGFYHLQIPSDTGEYVQVMDLTLRAGEVRRLRCDPSLRSCR